MEAFALVLTLLDATIAPPDMPSACQLAPSAMSITASATFSLPVTAVIFDACVAVTARLPVACTSASSRYAIASDGCCPSNASEISGSPRNASITLNSRFDGFQPIELNDSTKLTLSHDSIFDV